MLIVTSQSGEQATLYYKQTLNQFPVDWVKSVQADEQELISILNACTNLPRTNQRVQCWYGDDAKFIIGNLFI